MKKYNEVFKEDLIVNLIMLLGIAITLSMAIMFGIIVIKIVFGGLI